MSRDAPSSRQYATVDDLYAAVDRLSAADVDRILRVGARLAVGTVYGSAEALFDEAVLRAADIAGERHRPWPLDIPFVPFVIKTMKGLASDDRGGAYARSAVPLYAETGEIVESADLAAQTPGAMDQAIIDEAAAETKATMQKIATYFADDPAAQMVMMAELDGYRGAAAADVCGLDEKQYVAARKRLNRGFDKLFTGRKSHD
jgi:DNA-directed RNA polymerase specialized sigma24 family protein